jgi:hypothetical protein
MRRARLTLRGQTRHDAFITLPWRIEQPPPPWEGSAIQYPESLVRHFLREFTQRGDRVLDPFAGLGTTLRVAEEMGRVPYGMEYDARRHEWAAGPLKHWVNVRRGDSRKLAAQNFPKMDFCLTSPPFMPRTHRWNPLAGGNPADAGYAVYLRQMTAVFRQVAGIMKRNAPVVVQIDNVPGRVFTPLVRDVGGAIARALRPDGEIIVAWTNARPDYPHTHCLLFRK